MIIEHDLDNTPLLIKTDTIMNFSPEKLYVDFLGLQEKQIGGLSLHLDGTPSYRIGICSSVSRDLPNDLPSVKEKEWAIEKLPGPKLTVHCNNELVLDLLLTDDICTYYQWKKYWSRKMVKIRFDKYDTASDFYGVERAGNGESF